MYVESGAAQDLWASGEGKSTYAVETVNTAVKVTQITERTNLGLRSDGEWIAIQGLYSDNLPSICRVQVRTKKLNYIY